MKLPETVINRHTSEEGFVLVAALLIMLVLTIIGIAANRNTTTELLIAGNERTYKETFYAADSGAEIGQEVLEQNLSCIPGFKEKPGGFDAPFTHLNGGALLDNFAYIPPASLDLWRQFDSVAPLPTDANRNLLIPWNYQGNEPHTNITMVGDTRLTTGAAIQMAAGYEGKGKGISAGGTYLIYNIRSRHLGKNNSEAVISIQYRHIIGTEGDCYY